LVILRDKDDHERVVKRIDVLKILLKDIIKVKEIHTQGKTLLARIFSLIYTGDFISYYLAMLNNIDPTPIERISRLKGALK
jgi:glucose/mannose-6-phosphate isomerase